MQHATQVIIFRFTFVYFTRRLDGASHSRPSARPSAPIIFVLSATAGLEEIVAAEISAYEIGGFDVRPGKAGVSFR